MKGRIRILRLIMEKYANDGDRKEYEKHLKSNEWRKVKAIVYQRDKCCQFCGRTEEELQLKNGKTLKWNFHHLPEGYLHIYDSPEIEAQYVRMYCSACHHAAHQAPANRNRFTVDFTKAWDFEKNDKLLKSILGDNFSTNVIRCPGGYMSWKNMGELDGYLKELGLM